MACSPLSTHLNVVHIHEAAWEGRTDMRDAHAADIDDLNVMSMTMGVTRRGAPGGAPAAPPAPAGAPPWAAPSPARRPGRRHRRSGRYRRRGGSRLGSAADRHPAPLAGVHAH